MNVYVDLAGSETLVLKGALLVYQGKNRGFVTWHEVRRTNAEGAPFLGEAQEITTEFVQRLAEGLGTRVPVEVLPETVLARTAEMIAWWTPAAPRTMFYAAHDKDAAKMSGKRFPQPPLVWKVTGRDLQVRAISENRRPAAGAQLYVAPYWNVDGETGSVCQGTMRFPDDPGVAAIPSWERAFFQSEFTHQLGAKRLTTHPRGLLALWRGLRGRKLFPADHLVPAGETLREFITGD